MKLCLLTLLVTTLAACGSAPQFNRNIPFEEIGSPGSVSETRDSDRLTITVMDVGQGDSILIEAPSGQAILVDAGPSGSGIQSTLPCLNSKKIGTLEHVIITHNHSDHYGGLAEILSGPDGMENSDDDINVEEYIYVNKETSLEDDERGFGWNEDTSPPDRTSLHAGDIIQLGDVDLEIMASGARFANGQQIDTGEPPDENANSIVLLVKYAGFRMLLTGDITGGGGNPPYDTPDVESSLAPLVGDVDILKIAHHGSRTSTNEIFLEATTPEVAIISVGDYNDHSHPHPSVIERLIEAGISIYQTEKGSSEFDEPIVANGHVVVEVDADGDYRMILK